MAEYIEREAINRICFMDYFLVDGEVRTESVALVRDIEKLPAAGVAPVVYGLWMPIRESEMTRWNPAVAGRDPIGGYICSVCKEEAVYDCNDEFVLSNYCPNCGAKMDGGAENGKRRGDAHAQD